MVTIPTLSQLRSGIIADLNTQYGTNISALGKVFLYALASVQAAKLKLIYLAIGNLQKNIFVDTAESESLGGTLERFGRVKLGRNPFPAVQGQYEVTVTGTIGAVINAQTTFKSDDDSLSPGYLFILDEAYTLTATTDTITVRALTSGDASKLLIGDTLTATSPIALVDSSVEVSAISIQALDAETLETYRQLIIDSYRLETQGGSPADYRLWSADAQGVRRVYPYAKSGYANEINLYIEANLSDSTDNKGTPTALIIAEVEEVVELNPDTTLDILERGRRPLGVFEIHYLPITPMNVDITITGYTGITDAIKDALLLAITDSLFEIRPYVAGVETIEDKNDILNQNQLIGTVIQSQPGAIFTSITFTVDSVSYSSYTFLNGNIPYLNSITYN